MAKPAVGVQASPAGSWVVGGTPVLFPFHTYSESPRASVTGPTAQVKIMESNVPYQ